MPDIVVGVDAGGTRTIAALARGERVVRTSTCEGANVATHGIEAAAQTMARCIEAVLEGEAPAAIGIGAAGAGHACIRERLHERLSLRFPAARITIDHDARMALRAVVPKGDAMVIVAGTGSIAYAEIGERRFRAGGFGYLFGDAGSGYAIGAAALRRLLTSQQTGSGKSAMLDELASRAGGRDRATLLARFYQSPTPVADIASCATVVLRHAATGDEIAGPIVDDAADGLLEMIRVVVTRGERRALPLAFSGGLLRERNALCARLEERIARSALDVRVVETRREPYFGALSEGLRLIS